jgi:hypothetical protein
MWRYTSVKHVIHARCGSTSLQHLHAWTPDLCFPSAVVFRCARSSLAFSFGNLVDVSFTGLQQWPKITFRPGSRHRVTTYTNTLCVWTTVIVNPRIGPRCLTLLLNTHRKAKESREDHWRDFWMCENVWGQQVAQLHDSYIMVHLLTLYHNAQSASQCRISASFDHTCSGVDWKGSVMMYGVTYHHRWWQADMTTFFHSLISVCTTRPVFPS